MFLFQWLNVKHSRLRDHLKLSRLVLQKWRIALGELRPLDMMDSVEEIIDVDVTPFVVTELVRRLGVVIVWI